MNEVRLSFREKQLAVFAPDDRQHWSFPIQITVLESLSSPLWTWQLPIVQWLWDCLMRLVFVLKMFLFSYCVMKYVSIWKIWANIIQMAKTTCWNEFIESNTKVYSCNYTSGDRRHENQKFKANFNYTQSSNPGWATRDSGLKHK